MTNVDRGSAAFWILMIVGWVSGAASLWAFRRWSDAGKLRVAINRMVAHLMEFQLFTDEPGLIIRAQRDLIVANAQLLRLILLPTLLLAVPFAVLLAGMDAFLARAPLGPGEATVVTVQGRNGAGVAEAQLSVPAGIVVETPAVRVPGENQVSWRVRAVRAAAGKLRILCDGHLVEKTICAMPGLHWLSERRVGSVWAFSLHPFELPFSDTPVASVDVRYPRATVFDVHWLVWFSIASVVGAAVAGFVQGRV